MEYHKEQLKIAKEVADMLLEGCAYEYLGKTVMLSGSLDEAVVHFKLSVKKFEQFSI